MKVLPAEEKARIRNARESARRAGVAADLAHSDRVFRRVERLILLALGGIAALVAIALAWTLLSGESRSRSRYRPETYSAFTNLISMAETIENEHSLALNRIDFDLLANYALIENSADMSRFHEEVARARAVVLYSREETKMLFKEIYALFPPDSVNERHDAQKAYGELMTIFDVSEERIDAADKVLALLDDNRGKWHARKGGVTFSDASLETEFNSLRQDPDEETARWRRDFGSAGEEKAIAGKGAEK